MKRISIYILFCFALNQYLISQEYTIALEKAFNRGFTYHYKNKDSAYFYYKKAILIADKANDLESLFYTYQYLINANGHYYDLNNYHINLQQEDSLLNYDKRLDTFSYKDYFKDYLLFDKGNYNFKIKQYALSKIYFKELLSKIDVPSKATFTNENIALVSSIQAFLGEIYRIEGKYEMATYYINKDITLVNEYKDSISDWKSRLINYKRLLSKIAVDRKEFVKANALLNEVLSYYKTKTKDPSYKNSLLSTYLLIEKNEIKQGKYLEALQTLKENSKIHPNDNPFEREIDLIFGDAYLGLKAYQKAHIYYKKSLEKTSAYRNDQKHQDIATVQARLGNLFVKQHLFEKGLKHYQLALVQLEIDFNSLERNANPNPKKVSSKLILISILKEKLDALYNAYLINKNINYLREAHQTSKAIIATLDELRPEFESKLDKKFLIDKTYPSIQKMVIIAYELYHKTKKEGYVDDAFFFMEKSKSIFLLEAIRNAEATKYGQIPEDIIIREQQFRANISHLEQAIFNDKSNDITLLDSLSSLKNTYYNFLLRIEKNYPNYYDLKYNSNVISLRNIQQQLDENQAILSYLVTKNGLFLTIIDASQKTILKLKYDDELQKTIQKLYRKSSKLNIEDSTIFKNSYTVYNTIFKPALQITKATDLLIIADDLLHYIPFDALVTSANTPSYLLKTHSISYASSATLYQEHSQKNVSTKGKLLVFAPQFNGKAIVENLQRTEMTPLLYNQIEAKQIARFFKGKMYNGDQASKQKFNIEAGNYSLLHLATHASANDEYPDYSYLAFSNDSTSSNLLYVKDLYNYQINADLVTLSACQTGIGKLQKGEGMLSLARAFNYAGASAIVTTLWKINDQSTSEIMTNFYENLSNGMNKKEALRQAKLTYLEMNNDPLLNHPYYWSGIVLTGNTAPVTTSNYLRWILIVLGLGVIGFIYYRSTQQVKRAE